MNKEIHIEVPLPYAPFLVSERADAAAALLLGCALENGCAIRSDVPVSEDFYHSITEKFLPIMSEGGRYASLDACVLPPLPKGGGVGMRMSCGLDPLHAASKYAEYGMDRFRATHLCASNIDLGKDYSLTKEDADPFADIRGAAEDIGLPLAEIRTDVAEVFPEASARFRIYADVFIALSLKKLWRCFCFPFPGGSLGGNYFDTGSQDYGLFLLSCLSTPSFSAVPEGFSAGWIGKIADIAGYAPARKHFRPCRLSRSNCSRCPDCSAALVALDSLGKLDLFGDAFDIDFYRSRRRRYIRLMIESGEDPRFAQACGSFPQDDQDFMREKEASEAIRRYDAMMGSGQEEEAAELIRPLASSDVRAASRLADAYASGRGVRKDRGKELECLGYMADLCRKDIAGGFRSEDGLFDALWRSGASDAEMADAVRPAAEAGSASACERMSRVYSEGRGAEKDPDKAAEWMIRAAEADPSAYAEKCCEMLISAGRHEEAARLCGKYASVTGDPSMCAMMSGMCRDGKGTEKSLAEAAGWMAKAASADASYAPAWFRLAIDSGDPRVQAEAAGACLAACRETDSPDLWVLMSEMYREGAGVSRNMKEAVRWMRKAVSARPSRLSYDFFRLLQSSGDPSHQKEAFEGASERFANTGSTMYLALMARAYRDGRGAEKNVAKAVELMRKASADAPSKYLREYCELLVESDDPKDNEEAFRRCSALYAKNGSPFSCRLLAAMCRDGKGTAKDMDGALKWIGRYNEAVGGSDVSGYCDFLLGTGLESAYAEAWETCNACYAETGDPRCCGIIGRMLRDGKGAERNLDEAIRWMEKALLDDPAAWQDEFDALLDLAG